MTKPGFLEGVGVALAGSVLGSLTYSILGLVMPAAAVLRIVIAGLSLAYILYLFGRSRRRTGQVTIVIIWSLMMLMLWFFSSSILLFIAVNLILIWLVRSWYFHTCLPALLADLMLNGFALLAAAWAVTQSGSLLLACWCFFLVQALYTAIPQRSPQTHQAMPGACTDAERFQRAQRTAEAALQRLSSHS